MSTTRFQTSGNPGRPPTIYCPACVAWMPVDFRGRCVDCSALAEAMALHRPPRRTIPRACETPPRGRDRGPDLAAIAARSPAAARPILAALSETLSDAWSLVYVQGLTHGQAARRRGVTQPAMSGAVKRIRRRFAAGGLLESGDLMTGSTRRKFRKVRPDDIGAGERPGGPMQRQKIDIGGHVLDLVGAEVPGLVQTRPEVSLTLEEAEMQSRLCALLGLRRQGDVYGWMLDQIAAKLASAKTGEVPALFPPRAAR